MKLNKWSSTCLRLYGYIYILMCMHILEEYLWHPFTLLENCFLYRTWLIVDSSTNHAELYTTYISIMNFLLFRITSLPRKYLKSLCSACFRQQLLRNASTLLFYIDISCSPEEVQHNLLFLWPPYTFQRKNKRQTWSISSSYEKNTSHAPHCSLPVSCLKDKTSTFK